MSAYKPNPLTTHLHAHVPDVAAGLSGWIERLPVSSTSQLRERACSEYSETDS
jgi:hypothetical protein